MFEVIERSERGELHISEYDFKHNARAGGPRRIDAYYLERPRPAAMGIQAGLPADLWRALEIEALACFRHSYPPGAQVFWAAATAEDVEYDRIFRLRPVIDQEAPDWVAAVEGQATVYGPDDLVSILFRSGVPLVPALAILENLKESTR